MLLVTVSLSSFLALLIGLTTYPNDVFVTLIALVPSIFTTVLLLFLLLILLLRVLIATPLVLAIPPVPFGLLLLIRPFAGLATLFAQSWAKLAKNNKRIKKQ